MQFLINRNQCPLHSLIGILSARALGLLFKRSLYHAFSLKLPLNHRHFDRSLVGCLLCLVRIYRNYFYQANFNKI